MSSNTDSIQNAIVPLTTKVIEMDATDASVVAPSDGWWGTGVVRTEVSRACDLAATVDEVASEYRQDLEDTYHATRQDDGIGAHPDFRSVRDGENDFGAPKDVNPEVPICQCHAPCTRLMSRSERNPNRWFYKCAKFKDDPTQCKFFVWEDELAPKFPPTAEQLDTQPRVDHEGMYRNSVPDQRSPSHKRSEAVISSAPKNDGPLAGDQDQCFKCGLFGHWARDCSTEKVGSLATGRLPSQPHPGPSQGNNPMNMTTGQGIVSRAGHCYKCGGEGHWARDCQANSQNAKTAIQKNVNPVNTGGNVAGTHRGSCYLCGGEGHWARDCPQKNTGLAGNKRPYAGITGGGGSSGACFKCGQSGHWSNACPKR